MGKLTISISPHIKSHCSTRGIMLDVCIALLPALVASVMIFGLRALLVTAVCVAASVLFEFLFEKLCKRDVTIGDLSAVVTGILLAFNLPVTIPIWQAVVGSAVAIIVVKQLFGGLGMNFANPAITARIVMLIAFGSTMSHWVTPQGLTLGGEAAADLTASATPLAIISNKAVEMPEFADLLLGNIGGCIGETCTVAILIGGIYLMIKRVITPHIPLVFIGTVFVLSLFFAPETQARGLDGIDLGFISLSYDYAIYSIFSGALMLGAFFMATDYVTSPVTSSGKVVFAIGCGVITFMIRRFGSLPEGVSYAILFMNILTPYINKWMVTKPFGAEGGKA